MARSLVRFPLFFLAIACALWLAGCGESQPVTSENSQFKPAAAAIEPGAEKPADEASEGDASQPKPISVDRLDAESMPEGPAEAILDYMLQLSRYEPRGVTREAEKADYVRNLRLMMAAGDRVLIDKDATSEQRVRAAEIKMSAMNALAQRGEPKADEEMLAFVQRIKKDKDPAVSHMGRMVLFATQLASFEQKENADPQPLIKELKLLLEREDPDHVIFMLGNQAARVFNQAGHDEATIEVMNLLGTRYEQDADEQIATQAKLLLQQTSIVSLGFRNKFIALHEQPGPDTAGDLIETTNTMLQDPEAGAAHLDAASTVAGQLEYTEQYDAARQVLQLIDQRFSGSDNPQLAAAAKDAVEDSLARLSLIGQTFEITGNTLDGQPFDQSSLAGKVVLVDFWATWCRPCLEEVPNIKKYYELYKDKGFEVVGYNMDDEQQAIDQFFATQQLPWLTIVSADQTKLGFESELAVRCGVKGIPFLVLLDAEGNVVALHTRGDKLGEKLAQLLGPVEGAAPAGALGGGE